MANKTDYAFSEYRPVYSAGDIARLRGITPKGAKKWMRNLGVREHYIGSKTFYWLSDIETVCPEMLPSFIEAEQLNEELREQHLLKEEQLKELIRKVLNETDKE